MNALPWLAKLTGGAVDLLFPQWCVGCGREGDFICPSCRLSLPLVVPPLCLKCGKPQPGGTLCPSCVSWSAEIDGIRSPFRFEGVIRQAIYQLKYSNLRALAATLAKLLHDYLATNPVPGEVLVPVPLHEKRLRERGYNQSSLLVKELGKLSGLPVVDDCLTRKQPAPPQTRTSTVAERRSNVANAFACRDQRLRDKPVLLIDDVATSGATSVWGLALAREI